MPERHISHHWLSSYVVIISTLRMLDTYTIFYLSYDVTINTLHHRNDQHFIIPQMADSSLDLSELAKAAKKKLMALNNRLFEELAMDVYDEVDRRENETIWLSAQSNNSLVSDRQTVPFLPVNPEFSATRNQGRQKLARFNAREFATLIIDILSDAKRRQQGSPVSPPVTSMHKDKGLKMELVEGLRVKALRTNSMLSDDEPLYDSVASDEDYASIGDSHSAKGIKVDDKPDLPPDPVTNSNRSSSPSSMISFTESHGSSDMSDAPITVQEYIEVKRALAESQCQVKQLIQTNQDLKQEITLLQNMVQKLMLENQSLRNEETSLPNGHDAVSEHHLGVTRSTARPVSMFEPRDSTQYRPPIGRKPAHESLRATLQVQPLSESHTVTGDSSDYDIASGDDGSVVTHTSTMGSVSSHMTDSTLVPEGSAGASASVETIEGMPKQEQVVQKTENITKRIQELLLSAQDGKDESYQRCSEKIFAAVRDMTALFPQTVSVERVQEALIQLQSGADHLREECCQGPVEGEGTVDQRLRMQQVIQCAYDIAKAAKLLVMLFN
ncbi:ARF GTPase-activating protein GIT2 [Lamellibrachia satsuma]|nr:ARF GTPase-activating protein GIT2 [Lamellibrachia satsuma]